MSNYEATRYDFTGANLTGIEGIPTATIVPWTSSSLPTGFLECDGAAVSRSTYSALFAIVGTTYGSGDGSSTFNVPNLADNVAVSKSPNKALGSTGGANTVQSSGNVAGNAASHTLATNELASHAHPGAQGPQGLAPGGNPGNNNNGFIFGSGGNAGGGGGHTHNLSATFTGASTSVLQPYLTVIYIIKT